MAELTAPDDSTSTPPSGKDATTTDPLDPVKLDPMSRTESIQVQFPSLVGQPGVEVAERSSDVDVKSTKKHRKVFVVYTAGFDFDSDTFDHSANYTATRHYMVENGLRPLGDVKLVGVEPVDAKNTALTYEVEAVPAAVATTPDTANVVVPQS